MQSAIQPASPGTTNVMGFTRRQWLGRAGSAFGAMLLPGVASAGSEPAPRARAAIILFLQGGLSHYESFDPKPDASSEIRGELGTIPTTIPGVRFCEHLPLLAQRLGRFSVIRSAHHHTPDHNQAIHMTLCGCELPGANTDSRNRNVSPAMGAVVAFKKGAGANLPGYVAIPHSNQLGRRVHFADAGYLGTAYAPVDSGMLPERADGHFDVPADLSLNRNLTIARMQERSGLLERFQREPVSVQLRAGTELLAKGEVARAFDLNREPTEQRRRYGDHSIGQETILARRLIESGVPFTLVNYALDQVKGQDWDTHEKNFELMKNNLLPPMDRAVITLLDDLHERGLLDTTIVAILSEFGRTPRINSNAGRDHWPNVFSVVLAGGGIKPGIVLGSSTRDGSIPKDRPVHLYDVLATIYHQLGVRTDETFRDSSGRPVPILGEGRPISELI